MPELVKCALGKMRIEDVAASVGKSPTANEVNRDASLRVVQPCLLLQLRAAGMLQR
jgi:hypothetical protein